jgi:hypothetical protein
MPTIDAAWPRESMTHGAGRKEAKMTKSTVSRLFVGGVVAVVAGLFLTLVAVLIAFASGTFTVSGTEVTGIQPTAEAWTFITLALIGVVSLIGGAIAQLVAWIGALLNTALLVDKTWFILLLVLGLLSFGFIAMLVYVIAGPDGTKEYVQRNQPIYT